MRRTTSNWASSTRVRTSLRWGPAVLGACALLGAVACATEETGSAVPAVTAAGKSELQTSAMGPSESESAGGSTTSLNPCVLLRPAELTELAPTYKDGKEPSYGERGRTCQWVPELPNASAVLPVVAIYVWDEQGLGEVNEIQGGGIRHGSLNGREVAQAPGPDGCLIALAVSETSRVDVVVSSMDVSRQDRCAPAEKVAEIVEPKLPEG